MIPKSDQINYYYTTSTRDKTTQYELMGSLVCLAVTRVAYAVFESCYFQLLSLAVTSFLLTSLTKKFFNQYTSTKEVERVCLVILRKWPHLHMVGGIIASAVHPYASLASAFLAIGIGISSALVFRVKWLAASTLAQARRQ